MVNFGIIGCGKIGTRHINFLNSMEGVRVSAVADVIRERAEEASKISSSKIFTDYREMVKDPDIDIINVCTPSGLHASMSIDALNAGKHVICEKPMALSTRDADKMIEASKVNNKKLFIVKQNRFNKPIIILKDAAQKGNFGKIYSIIINVVWNRRPDYYLEADWRGTKKLDGGALFTQASHFIDILHWIGGPVRSVFAKTENFLHNIETEDTGAILLKFKSGGLGSIYYTNCAYNRNIEGSITVLGTKGSAKISGEYLNKIEYWNVEGYPLPVKSDETASPNDYGSYRGSSSKHDFVFRDVIRNILGDNESLVVDGYEGKKSVELMEAALISSEIQKEVTLPLNIESS